MTDKSRKTSTQSLVPVERIEGSILLIRGHKVMREEALAELYQVDTGYLVRQVKRNIERFPNDFMFQLTQKEWEVLKSHFGISNTQRLFPQTQKRCYPNK